MRRIQVALVLSVLASVPCGAQGLARAPADSAVPRELFDAIFGLMMGPFGARNQVFAGELPPSVGTRLYLPPGSRVVGGVQGGPISLGIVYIPISPDSADAVYGREMTRLGWSKLTSIPGMPDWGFRPAPGTRQAADQGLRFCSGSQVLTIGLAPPAGGRPTRMSVTAMQGSCGSVADSRAAFTENPYGGAPTLVNPPASTSPGMANRCSRSGRSTSSSSPSTSLRTSMSPREILDHYNRQLSDSGWVASPGATDVVESYWHRTDSTGAELEVKLTVSANPDVPGCRDVEMRYTGTHR